MTSTHVKTLGDRCRGEFLEMPGLRLTVEQAARLWHLDARTCAGVLEALVESGFLKRIGGTYGRADEGRRRS